MTTVKRKQEWGTCEKVDKCDRVDGVDWGNNLRRGNVTIAG